MISPDYFDFRWSWYRPIINRQERPGDRCAVEVRRLPIRISGQDAGEYIPYALHGEVENAINSSIRRLQDYAIRYMVKGEKVSAHTLPQMDARVRAMVAYLRKQNPHISRDLLHHWCAEPKGAAALLNVCEVLWEQGWKQDQADAAPWVPAVNVLLLRLIRKAIASLPAEEAATTNHIMLCVVGGLYVWALQEFLKRYLEGVVEVARIANYESMMMPATPMAFMQHQPDSSLLADDSRLIRAYGLEPEIVPQMRHLIAKVGSRNEGGILALLTKEKLGAHLLRRTWARLSLWKLAQKSGHGFWMRWVLDAKRLDQLLAGQAPLEAAAIADLKNYSDEPVAAWLLALSGEGKKLSKKDAEPWLHDRISLLAFRVFDEDVKVEVARRKAEASWVDRKTELAAGAKQRTGLVGMSELRAPGGLRGGRNVDGDKALERAWQEGELVLIQPDVTKALHSGKALSLRHGCMRVDWADYLARMHAIVGADATRFLDERFMPTIFSVVDAGKQVFLDECTGSGCMLRGTVISLTETALLLRQTLRKLYFELSGRDQNEVKGNLPVVAMCMDMTGEWTFSEQSHAKLGTHRIAFSLAVPQVEAGIARDSGIGRMMRERDEEMNQRSIGRVNVEQMYVSTEESVQIVHNEGLALTSSALKELTTALRGKADVREFRLSPFHIRGVLDGFRLPRGGLELLVIQRYGDEGKMPWLLMKAGKPSLGGVDVDLYELLDEQSEAASIIVNQGLSRWQQ